MSVTRAVEPIQQVLHLPDQSTSVVNLAILFCPVAFSARLSCSLQIRVVEGVYAVLYVQTYCGQVQCGKGATG